MRKQGSYDFAQRRNIALQYSNNGRNGGPSSENSSRTGMAYKSSAGLSETSPLANDRVITFVGTLPPNWEKKPNS
ncbi:Hypothetical protein NTJ_12426 [Nesidiocoris tenuis]|uniref:Uncharacterized protein n=1 Tax=Nesidiocoris tenuis TaxID=355587 RepID=A0ABN7B5D5_9HEMI|nr:Hypothetical protein NTJ_12426 [Nesidiocoris tenuis]